MSDRLLKESDAIEAVWKPQVKPNELIFDALKQAIESEIRNCPTADRPQGEWNFIGDNMFEETPNNFDKDINVRSKTEPSLVKDSQVLAKDLVNDEFNPYDEECMRCKHLKLQCEFIPSYCKYEPRDEPQTEREDE